MFSVYQTKFKLQGKHLKNDKQKLQSLHEVDENLDKNLKTFISLTVGISSCRK